MRTLIQTQTLTHTHTHTYEQLAEHIYLERKQSANHVKLLCKLVGFAAWIFVWCHSFVRTYDIQIYTHICMRVTCL